MRFLSQRIFKGIILSLLLFIPLSAINLHGTELKIEKVRTSFEFGINYGYPYFYYNYYPYGYYYPYYDCPCGFGLGGCF